MGNTIHEKFTRSEYSEWLERRAALGDDRPLGRAFMEDQLMAMNDHDLEGVTDREASAIILERYVA